MSHPLKFLRRKQTLGHVNQCFNQDSTKTCFSMMAAKLFEPCDLGRWTIRGNEWNLCFHLEMQISHSIHFEIWLALLINYALN